MLEKIYEYCYTKREIMLHDIKKVNLLDRIIFKVISYFANKY